MNSDTLVRNWHAKIIAAASSKLGRELSERERKFIVGRAGFMALEAIEDTVNSEPRESLDRYLNPEV